MKNPIPTKLTHNDVPEAVAKVYDEVFLIRNELNDLKQNFQPKTPTEYLTRNEVAELLKCDLSTIHNWTKKGKLIPFGIGSRVYFKRSDIESLLIPIGKNKGDEASK